MDARRRLVISVAMLLGFVPVGTLGYVVIEDASALQAVFMTVITISTVGYSETIDLSPGGRIFTMLLIMAGVGCVFYASISLITLFVEGELRTVREKLKVKKRIDELRDHVIVCGYGRMGSLVCDQLGVENTPIVIIDHSPERIAVLESAGLPAVQGDAAEEATLQAAGIARARALVATLPRDSDNVYVTLTAKGLATNLMVIARAESTATEAKLLRAGADRVVCPQVIGAYRISSLITRPNVVDFVDVAARRVELQIDEYRVGEESFLAGKSLRESGLRLKVGAIVVAINRADGGTIFNPLADEVVNIGDTLILIGRLGMSGRLSRL